MPRLQKARATRPILRKSTPKEQFAADNRTGKALKGPRLHVKWDPETKENEHRAKPRTRATKPVKKTATALLVLQNQAAAISRKVDDLEHERRSFSQGGHRYRAPSPHPVSIRSGPHLNDSHSPGRTRESSKTSTQRRIEPKFSPEHRKATHLEVPRSRDREHHRSPEPSQGRHLEVPSAHDRRHHRSPRAPREHDRGHHHSPGPSRGRSSTADYFQQPAPNMVPLSRFEVFQDLILGRKPPKRSHDRHVTYMIDIKTPVRESKLRESEVMASVEARRDFWIANHLDVERRQRAPPAVPDPPVGEGTREPPPAPRPARLPTPDLPDIDGNYFEDLAVGYGPLAGRTTWTSGDSMYEDKMDFQVQNAMAHIHESRS